jgi:hypothetical protein
VRSQVHKRPLYSPVFVFESFDGIRSQDSGRSAAAAFVAGKHCSSSSLRLCVSVQRASKGGGMISILYGLWKMGLKNSCNTAQTHGVCMFHYHDEPQFICRITMEIIVSKGGKES